MQKYDSLLLERNVLIEERNTTDFKYFGAILFLKQDFYAHKYSLFSAPFNMLTIFHDKYNFLKGVKR